MHINTWPSFFVDKLVVMWNLWEGAELVIEITECDGRRCSNPCIAFASLSGEIEINPVHI